MFLPLVHLEGDESAWKNRTCSVHRALILSTNAWPFPIAVENELARHLSTHCQVDGLCLYKLLNTGIAMGWRDVLYERLNRKYERFVAPHLSGKDLTSAFRRPKATAPRIPDNLNELRSYQLNGCKLGLAALSTAASLSRMSSLTSTKVYGCYLQAAWTLAHQSETIAQQVMALNYDSIYLFNGRHCLTRPFCDLFGLTARVWRYEYNEINECNVPRAAYLMSDENLHTAAGLVKLISNYPLRQEAGHRYFQERINRKPGSDAYFFTRNQSPGLLPDGLEAGGFVTMFSSSPDEFFALYDTYSFGEFPTQGAVAEAVARVCAGLGLRFVVRLHPHLQYKPDSWKEEWDFQKLRGLGATVVNPGDKYDSYALMKASKAIITCGSTIGVEAAYFGQPSMAIGEGYYNGLGAVRNGFTEAEITQFLKAPACLVDCQENAVRLGSFNYTGGIFLRYFLQPAGPETARIDGELVDPVRSMIVKIKNFLKRFKR